MQVEVHDEKKLVCIWLAGKETDDPAVQALLRPLFKQYKARKYTAAVFYSGNQDLTALTSELLKYNRRLLAEKEVRAEQISIDHDRSTTAPLK